MQCIFFKLIERGMGEGKQATALSETIKIRNYYMGKSMNINVIIRKE